jgi:osmotically-inducible protein OsmY
MAAVVAAFSYAQAFAAESANAAPAATAATSPQAGTTKKSIRAANRAFSRKVQKVLVKTKGLDDTSIAVFGTAATGHVTLAGQIASQDQDGLAVDAAKKVEGVTSVSSKLTVREEGGS